MTFKRKNPPPMDVLLSLYRYNPTTGDFYHLVARGGVEVGELAGTRLKNGRIQICVLQERYHAHRLAWYIEYGTWPDEIDHEDNNPGNNRIKNLREATRLQNIGNSKGWSKKYPKGVYKLTGSGSKKYGARIGIGYKLKHLGCFDTIAEAKAAYNKAARVHFKEFYRP